MTSAMYPFFESMRKQGRLTDTQIDNAVTKGYTTADEAVRLKFVRVN
ncbi:MAG: hypothetical protein WC455_24310 [Dehalococcoidia bacterium]|jgi:hypothetical protein